MRLRALVALLVLLAAGCADDPIMTSPGEPSPPGWERLPDAPLAGRTGASAVAVGSKVYVFGGWPFLCPPNADCGPADPPFSDGAVLDLGKWTWTAMADAPFGFTRGSSATVGDDIYVVTGCARTARCSGRPELLRYETVGGTWAELGAVPKDVGTQLVATDHGLVALSGSDEQGEAADAVLDTSTGTWTTLPDDPLPESYDRFAVPDGDRLLVFGSPIGEPDEEARAKEAAAYDWGTGVWAGLPSAPAGGYQAWSAGDRVFLNPHFSKDGGGVLDLVTDTWGVIPDEGSGWEGDAAGVVADDAATYEYAAGWVFDSRDDTWVEIPARGGDVYDDSVAAVGQALVVFGGQTWEGSEGRLLAQTWIWRPPAG